MAVREFDGVDDRIALGSLEEPLVNGAYSIIALVKPSGTLPGGKAYVALRSGSSMVASLGDGGAGKIADYTDAAGQDAVAGLTVGAWQIIAVTKPAGTSTVRFHRKQLGSGSWTHANGGTLPDVPGTVDNLVLGGMNPSNGIGAAAGRMAVAAVYGNDFADGDVEAIQATPTSQFLADLGAVGLWETNQASTATAVTDAIADADQTGINETTVVTGDDPSGWTFGVTVIPPLEISLRLSGGASNADPALSYGGAISSNAIGGNLFDPVENAERNAGLQDYRVIYVHNDDTDDGVAVAYIQNQLESGREIALGVPTQAAGVTVTAGASDVATPAGVTFLTPTTALTAVSLGTIGAGSYRGLWLRRTINAAIPVDPTNSYSIKIEVSRAA
jgi:hypothetical protein